MVRLRWPTQLHVAQHGGQRQAAACSVGTRDKKHSGRRCFSQMLPDLSPRPMQGLRHGALHPAYEFWGLGAKTAPCCRSPGCPPLPLQPGNCLTQEGFFTQPWGGAALPARIAVPADARGRGFSLGRAPGPLGLPSSRCGNDLCQHMEMIRANIGCERISQI